MTICDTKILNFYQTEDRNNRTTIIWACKKIIKLMNAFKKTESIKQRQYISSCLILIIDLLLLKEEQGDNYLLKKDNIKEMINSKKELFIETLKQEFNNTDFL